MIIERANTEVIFRLPSNVDIDDLQSIADFFEYKELASKSTAKQEEIDELVETIKKGRWNKTKKLLEE